MIAVLMYTVTVLDTLRGLRHFHGKSVSVHRCSFLPPVVQDTPNGVAAYRFPRHTFEHDGTADEIANTPANLRHTLMIIRIDACVCVLCEGAHVPAEPS